VYIYTYSSQYRESDRATAIKKNGTAGETACHFGHAYHRFVSPRLYIPKFDRKDEGK